MFHPNSKFQAIFPAIFLSLTGPPKGPALLGSFHQGVWPEVEQGLAKAGVETISIWSDPMDDCALYM